MSLDSDQRWMNPENFWALFAIVVGALVTLVSYRGVLESCGALFIGTGPCFFSGSGGIEVLALLIVGILFVSIGTLDLALRLRKTRGQSQKCQAFELHSMDPENCSEHTLVSHVAVLHHNSALLVKYREMPDGQSGWFLPNDDLRRVEHPEEGAKRILRVQVGIQPSTLKLAQIESFVGNNNSWHLIFDYLAFPLSMKINKGPNILDAQWFELDKLPPATEFAHQGWGHSTLVKLSKTQF